MTTLRGWLHATVWSTAGLAAASGFGQFGVIALLGDLADAFGEPAGRGGIAPTVGMAGTTLGVGLAIIRLASLASLPAASIADRFGRRRVLIAVCAAGLGFTVVSAASPSWWWFVAILAVGRPLLAATNAVAGVIAAEETTSQDRSKAIALVSAAFAVGSGLFAVSRALLDQWIGFRGMLALAVVPLLLVPLLGRRIEEPERFTSATVGATPRRRLVGPMPRSLRPRLVTLSAIHFATGLLSGPVNSYIFLYGEQVQGVDATAMAALFVASGVTGMAGLLAGRWGADRLGRRVTAASGLVAGATFAFVTYSGSRVALFVAYPLTVLAAAAFTPAAGALDAELFPTRARATAAGWIAAAQILGGVCGLAAFGVLADTFASFTAAAAAVCVPVAALSLAYVRLPETRGLRLEESGRPPTDDS
ncbi:MAG: MFS transporter [Actinomycetota bacterium]|nr:MFS transporter [Actinomycetota bacterium]